MNALLRRLGRGKLARQALNLLLQLGELGRLGWLCTTRGNVKGNGDGGSGNAHASEEKR